MDAHSPRFVAAPAFASIGKYRMTKPVAVWLLTVITIAAIGWTVLALMLETCGEYYTTSLILRRIALACPAVGILIVVIAIRFMQDAAPEISPWLVVLFFVAAFSLGHSLWAF